MLPGPRCPHWCTGPNLRLRSGRSGQRAFIKEESAACPCDAQRKRCILIGAGWHGGPQHRRNFEQARASRSACCLATAPVKAPAKRPAQKCGETHDSRALRAQHPRRRAHQHVRPGARRCALGRAPAALPGPATTTAARLGDARSSRPSAEAKEKAGRSGTKLSDGSPAERLRSARSSRRGEAVQLRRAGWTADRRGVGEIYFTEDGETT